MQVWRVLNRLAHDWSRLPAVRRVRCCQLEPLRSRAAAPPKYRLEPEIEFYLGLFCSMRNDSTCKALLFRPGENLGHPIEGQQLPSDGIHLSLIHISEPTRL